MESRFGRHVRLVLHNSEGVRGGEVETSRMYVFYNFIVKNDNCALGPLTKHKIVFGKIH